MQAFGCDPRSARQARTLTAAILFLMPLAMSSNLRAASDLIEKDAMRTALNEACFGVFPAQTDPLKWVCRLDFHADAPETVSIEIRRGWGPPQPIPTMRLEFEKLVYTFSSTDLKAVPKIFPVAGIGGRGGEVPWFRQLYIECVNPGCIRMTGRRGTPNLTQHTATNFQQVDDKVDYLGFPLTLPSSRTIDIARRLARVISSKNSDSEFCQQKLEFPCE